MLDEIIPCRPYPLAPVSGAPTQSRWVTGGTVTVAGGYLAI